METPRHETHDADDAVAQHPLEQVTGAADQPADGRSKLAMISAHRHDGEATIAALIPVPDNPQAVLEASPDRATFVLIALDRARQWLVSAGSIQEVNELRARAEAVRVNTRQAELGKEAENAAAEIRLRAERRVGELLKVMQLAPGRPRKRSSTTTISGGGGRP